MLVVGNLFDAATRYEGATTVAELLPNSRLLTVNGWGHTSLGLSLCADEAVARYLVDLALPAPGTVCSQDIIPFTPAAPATAEVGAAESEAAKIVHVINLPSGGERLTGSNARLSTRTRYVAQAERVSAVEPPHRAGPPR